jgi:predicted double-glycine peptidase
VIDRSGITVNPFVSEAQRRACYAKDDPAWDCGEWESKTKKKLPKKVKKPTTNALKRGKTKRKPPRKPGPTFPYRDRPASGPNAWDPSRTATLRRSLEAELVKRFQRLKGAVVRKLVDEDELGLTANAGWEEERHPRDEKGRWVGAEYDPSSMYYIDEARGELFIGLIRTYRPGDLKRELDRLEEVARGAGVAKLAGHVTGDARLRIFRRHGFTSTGVVEDRGDDLVYRVERSVPPTANCRPGQLRDEMGRCGHGVGDGVSREDMPQIPKDQLPEFINYLSRNGVPVVRTLADPATLTPVQSEFRQERVDAMDGEALKIPLLVSRDGKVLDGLHRWVKARQGKVATVPVLCIDADAPDALELMHDFEGVKYTVNVADDPPVLDVPDIRQRDDYSCGASVTMAFGRYFGVGPETLEEWKALLGTTEENSTLPRHIVGALRSLGLTVEERDGMELDDLRGYLSRGMPVIVPLQEYGVPSKQASFKYGHYVGMIGLVGDQYVVVQDPSADNVISRKHVDIHGLPDELVALAVRYLESDEDGGQGEGTAEGFERWLGQSRWSPRQVTEALDVAKRERSLNQDSNMAPGRNLVDVDRWMAVWHDEDAEGRRYVRYGIAVGLPTTENFDPSQARDAAGRWTSSGLSHAASALKSAGATAEHLEELAAAYAKDHIGRAVAKLPLHLQAAVNASFAAVRGGTKVAFATWRAGQAMAERVARERGLSDEEARRLRGVLSTLDLAAFKPIALGLEATGVGLAAVGAASFIPLASASYLAYSTARDPMATLRAARGAIRDAAKRVRHKVTGNSAAETADLIADTLGRYGYDDGYIARLSAALDGTGDLRRAMRLAEEPATNTLTPVEVPHRSVPGTYTAWVANYDPEQARDERGRFVRESSEAFKKWFAGSKVVDKYENDRPLVVYHGTHVRNVAAWQPYSDAGKVRAFRLWLRNQIDQTIKGKDTEELLRRYAEAAMRKGAGRAFDDTQRFRQLQEGQPATEDFYRGSREQFLRDTFRQPVSVERLEALAERSFSDLDGVTDAMETGMVRELMDGLAEGKNPYEIAKDLNQQVDGIGIQRARLIARTEVIRAHSEGQLDGLENLGVEEVGVAVEWSSAGNDCEDLPPKVRKLGGCVCKKCAAMDGVVLKITEARNLIPLHPNCRCAFVPANVGEDEGDQTRTRRGIERAADEADVDLDVSTDRPESIFNVRSFFATCDRDHLGHCVAGEGGEGTGTAEYASWKELANARKLAIDKAAAAPVPTQAAVREANRRIGVLGADGYQNQIKQNTADRRRSRNRLVEEFGDGYSCPCIYCGKRLVADGDSENTVTRDKIYTAREGGRYHHENLVPACLECNKGRGDVHWEDIVWKSPR